MPAAVGRASRPGRTLPKTRVWGLDLPEPSTAPGEPPVLAAFRIWPGAGVTTTTRRAVPDKFGDRYYDPGIGRWTQEDSVSGVIANPATVNRYVYAGDNPTNYRDPTGKDFWSCAGAAVGGFTSALSGFNGSPGVSAIGIGFWAANVGVDVALAADLATGALAAGLAFGGGLIIGAGLAVAAVGIVSIVGGC